MTTLHPNLARQLEPGPYAETYRAAQHYRDREHEFDAVKMGVWLFLATEILLFSGLFCYYGVVRMLHPETFVNGSAYLDVNWGALNTVVLLISSWTMASAVRSAQVGAQRALRTHLLITFFCGLGFMVIKFAFEYYPKWVQGKLPGKFFSYPHAPDLYQPLWWGLYWGSTGIHASHVLVGMGLLLWLFFRARRGHFGPAHYNAVEGVGLYWHIVDMVWIFLFPLLYLIH